MFLLWIGRSQRLVHVRGTAYVISATVFLRSLLLAYRQTTIVEPAPPRPLPCAR